MRLTEDEIKQTLADLAICHGKIDKAEEDLLKAQERVKGKKLTLEGLREEADKLARRASSGVKEDEQLDLLPPAAEPATDASLAPPAAEPEEPSALRRAILSAIGDDQRADVGILAHVASHHTGTWSEDEVKAELEAMVVAELVYEIGPGCGVYRVVSYEAESKRLASYAGTDPLPALVGLVEDIGGGAGVSIEMLVGALPQVSAATYRKLVDEARERGLLELCDAEEGEPDTWIVRQVPVETPKKKGRKKANGKHEPEATA